MSISFCSANIDAKISGILDWPFHLKRFTTLRLSVRIRYMRDVISITEIQRYLALGLISSFNPRDSQKSN